MTPSHESITWGIASKLSSHLATVCWKHRTRSRLAENSQSYSCSIGPHATTSLCDRTSGLARNPISHPLQGGRQLYDWPIAMEWLLYSWCRPVVAIGSPWLWCLLWCSGWQSMDYYCCSCFFTLASQLFRHFWLVYQYFHGDGSHQSNINSARSYFVDSRNADVSLHILFITLGWDYCCSILPPNTVYATISVEDCIITGGYYLSASTLSHSIYGLIHSFIFGPSITGANDIVPGLYIQCLVHYFHTSYVVNNLLDTGNKTWRAVWHFSDPPP